MTIRTRLKRLERLIPPAPPKPPEPLAQFMLRPEVNAAFNADPEFVAARRAVYQIFGEAFEREGERPPADFLPGWPYSELTPARRPCDPERCAWIKECRPEVERICNWMARTPRFNARAWVTERRPDFVPAMARWVTATKAVLRKRFGRTE